ncbi:hypothetical protein RchiOBHm_Chr6g0277771 [Rosa chinensis]|uniref:Uncharacterized protein n=1 Tax=Rosa chinensis TaxID=74649 RepID=A0A2P6PSM1_ROSCH|nr:hypothetical protein RchiOBHm_Chr6g0277771 [Rosa chinensis]
MKSSLSRSQNLCDFVLDFQSMSWSLLPNLSIMDRSSPLVVRYPRCLAGGAVGPRANC